MIITKTPFRMSFFGGGTDIPDFFQKNRGAVIVTTIDKYAYITVRHLPRFFNHTTELFYSKIEKISNINEMEHPMVRNAMKMLDMHELHISYDADLPARTGLGTSSAFAVGLLNAFYCLKGKYRSKKELANDAIYLERVLCKEAGGWQDQIAVSYGGLNRIDFDSNGYHLHPIVVSPDRKKQLNDNLILFFTGFTRFSADIQKEVASELNDKNQPLNKMLLLVDKAQSILEDEKSDLDDFGRLLNETWLLKKKTSNAVSNNFIDEYYSRAIKAGALGGKLLGAGGGGFLLFYVQPAKQEAVRKELNDLMEVPFAFEGQGTRIIYYTPETFDKDSCVEI